MNLKLRLPSAPSAILIGLALLPASGAESGASRASWRQEAPARSSEPAQVAQGLAQGYVEFANRDSLVPLLRASRIAQEARLGLWSARSEPRPFRDASSLRRVPPTDLRGVALPMHSLEADYDYSRELHEIAELGAKWVSLQVVTLQEQVDSIAVPLTSERTPPDERILETIRRARAAGLEVLLLPIVLIRNPGPDDWRGTLAPANRAAWWESYSRYILHLVDLAAEAGAAAVCVGSELASLERDELRWKVLIANVRMRFEGFLTYSSNWDHYDEIRYWRQLDFAGMTAYFELSDEPDPTLEQLAGGWRHAKSEIERLARYSHQPVLLTEVGLPSLKGAAAAPWDYTARGESDLDLQRRSFEAFRKVFLDERDANPHFLGMLLYDWWGEGGEGDSTYTARGKPAAEVWAELLRK